MPDDSESFDLSGAIEHLREAAAGPERERILAVIRNYSLSPEQLKNALPEDLAILLPTLLSNKIYDDFFQQAPVGLREKLSEAKSLAEEHFSDFRNHPVVAERLSAAGEEALLSPDDWPSLNENRTILVGMTAFWNDVEGKLAPAMRLVLLGPADKASVEMIADPTDPLILSEALLKIAVSEFRRCLPMADKQMLEFEYSDQVPLLLDSLEQELKKLRELAPQIGIDLRSAPPE
jgi:hypothetical protein